jgi:predicted outer membrane lipoprotein
MTAALPWVIESNYFPWIIGVTLSVASFQALLAMGVKTYRWLKPVPANVTEAAKVTDIDNGSSPGI